MVHSSFFKNNEQTVNSVVSKEDLSLETEKNDVAEKDKVCKKLPLLLYNSRHGHLLLEDIDYVNDRHDLH